MIDETASSLEDRPALRSSLRKSPDEDNQQQIELRELISAVFVIEDESFDEDLDVLRRDSVLLMNPEMRLIGSYTGQLLLDSEMAYNELDREFVARDLIPVFREFEGKQVIHVLSGRVKPQPRAVWVNAVLFGVTVITMLMMGTFIAIGEIDRFNPGQAEVLMGSYFLQLWRGFPYAASLLLILGSHELGHYFAARYHRLAVTLPYFIPAPPPIGLLGTFGAFIQLREPMRNRKALLDVGAAGPLIGLIFAIPIVFIGLATSYRGPISAGGYFEGNSMLYALMKIIINGGEYLPNGINDFHMNQLATAGWAGLLITALNLMPIGQLDGGHILYSLIGNRARRLYFPLVGLAIGLTFVSQMWILWVLLLLLFGRMYAAPLDMITPLNPRRFYVAILALVTFIFIFPPVPLTPIEAGSGTAPSSSAYLIPVLTTGMVLLWQRLRR
jgi:hypothetical protein